ncbi:hypothetical protein [Hymenobacter sp. BRD67]|uniref:hypothetical protein n=1 Tax=Hymenobacter sp. BRD67 TaxID=2675877 RepID=UPI00156781C8|nr:hypothetical protein [Hymenobacter sp. BRD67]QKG53290.1 hypothetical protein GKZ67_12710 [Hymenobacter sp. BRD67]
MQDKYSLAKCEQYGRRLATRLSQQFFGTQPDATLDGPALLKFTPVRQVNLLLLRQLLGRWQQEANALRSPYFNFEAEAVRAALGQFMNVLSRHIRLDRAALEPLLAQAISDTLVLATAPAEAFERLVLPPAGPDAEEAIPLAYLRDHLRYLDRTKEFFEGFVNSLPPSNAPLSREFLRQRFDLYLTANAKMLPPLSQLVPELSTLLPLTEADLWDDGPAKPAAPVTVAPPAPAPEKPAPAISTPAAVPEISPALLPTSPAAAPAATDPVIPIQPLAGGVSAETPLYAKLKATQPSTPHLADTLREAAHAGAAPLAERGRPR